MSKNKKKKVLFVRPTMGYGGADRVTLNILLAFDRDKYECDLALMRAEGEFMSNLPSDVILHDMQVRSLWHFWKPLRNLLLKHRFDIIYSTCGGAGVPMMIAAWLSGFKGISVVSERNILLPPYKSWWKRLTLLTLKGFLYKRATWVTAVSMGVAAECAKLLKVSTSKIVVVNNPIINKPLLENKLIKVKHPTFLNNTKPVILAVGRLEYQKDYWTLFKAFNAVLNEVDCNLVILGKGPLLAEFQLLVEEMGLSQKVVFGGFDKNPFNYMANCSLYVLSSRHEGMPGTLIQAMACGAACIATDCPTGPNELIKDGQNGYLVPVGDYELLARRMISVLENEKLRNKFRKNAPQAVTRFIEEQAIASYFQFLR